MGLIKTFETKNLKHNQALRWLKEWFEKNDMNDKVSQQVKDSFKSIDEYFKINEIDAIMWNIVKEKLTNKQLLYVIEKCKK